MNYLYLSLSPSLHIFAKVRYFLVTLYDIFIQIKKNSAVRNILPIILSAFVVFACSNSSTQKAESKPSQVQAYKLEVVAEYPHDVTSYTQGLFFHDGIMYESTGQYGKSTLRKVNLQTGEAIQRQNFSKNYFVEGSVVLGENLYVLTWMEKVAFIYDAATLKYKSARTYPREGWGITTDGKSLIASDGSSYLYFLDDKLNPQKRLQVKIGSRPVQWLNELEYINGKIWANVYTSDEIVIIDPATGYIEGVVDCRGLLPQELRTVDTDVLNGIAFNPKDGKIYLTGKNWPKLYEIKLVSAN